MHFITPIQIGKIYMKHLQGWLAGITIPKYAANIEGGGGKVLLLPSGHDTLNIGNDIEANIAESRATVSTWDGKKFFRYEALGRASRAEFDEAQGIMDAFIGRSGVFLPKVIIVDEKGKYIETTNRTSLPSLEQMRKSTLLSYKTEDNGIPLTNPMDIADELEKRFRFSKYGTKSAKE